MPYDRRTQPRQSHPPRAASTDAAHAGAAQALSAHDRRAATDGPSEDDRFGEGPVAADLAGRILSVSVERRLTRIVLSRGTKDGVHLGMEGYVRRDGGMLADFQIDRVDASGRSCSALVEATPDLLQAHAEVLINPSRMPASTEHKKPLTGRIIRTAVKGGKTQITINRGTNDGVRHGAKGVVGSEAAPVTRFEVDEVQARSCTAFVDRSVDEISRHSQVVLTPAGA